jgi:hypothetical protein
LDASAPKTDLALAYLQPAIPALGFSGSPQTRTALALLPNHYLPAIPAISSVSAVPAISAAPAATASATPAAATAVASATSTASAAFGLRPRFVDHQVPTAKVLPVQRIHCPVRFFIIVDFDKRKTARLPGKAVADEVHRRRIYSCLRKEIV